MRVLVDTSVWIDFFRGRDNPRTGRLVGLIGEGEDLCLCGVVLTEVLQGSISGEEKEAIEERFTDLLWLPMERSTYVLAAGIYREVRAHGKTVRKPVDCMIAAVCLEQDVALLHHDRDFDVIGECFGLSMVL